MSCKQYTNRSTCESIICGGYHEHNKNFSQFRRVNQFEEVLCIISRSLVFSMLDKFTAKPTVPDI